MNRLVFTHRRVLAVIAMLLVVVSQLPAKSVGLVSNTPRNIVDALLNPLTGSVKRLSDSLRGRADLSMGGQAHDSYEQAKKYNQQLLTHNRQLEAELEDAYERIEQLSQIRQSIRIPDVLLSDASVTRWSGDSTNPTLTINKGRMVGLREGLVAVADFNLVGRISGARQAASTIRLITAPNTLLTVRIVAPIPGIPGIPGGEPPREFWPVQLMANREGEFIAVVSEDQPIQIGDLAHLEDRTWPREARAVVVGKVVEIAPDPNDPVLRQRVVIQPIRSLRHLSRLVVLVPSNGA